MTQFVTNVFKIIPRSKEKCEVNECGILVIIIICSSEDYSLFITKGNLTLVRHDFCQLEYFSHK